jgi:hypothetical protein
MCVCVQVDNHKERKGVSVCEGEKERKKEREREREDGVGPPASQRRISSPNRNPGRSKKEKGLCPVFQDMRAFAWGWWVGAFLWLVSQCRVSLHA